jgi:polyisoprenoid-binding protein YceI
MEEGSAIGRTACRNRRRSAAPTLSRQAAYRSAGRSRKRKTAVVSATSAIDTNVVLTIQNLKGKTMSTTPVASQAKVSTWNADPVHSVVEFKVKHMMISNVKGQFTGITGY